MTPFGVMCRNLRTEHSVSQKTLAAALSVSPSYLSAIERGTKGDPNEDLIGRITEYFSLVPEQAAKLRRSAQWSRTHIKLPGNLPPNVYQVASLLQQRACNLSEKELRILKDVLDDEKLTGSG